MLHPKEGGEEREEICVTILATHACQRRAALLFNGYYCKNLVKNTF